MAMTTCAECNKEISDQTTACPHCGAPTNRKGAGKSKQTQIATAIFWIMVLGFFGWIWTLTGGSHDTPAKEASAPAQQTAPAVAAEPKPSPAPNPEPDSQPAPAQSNASASDAAFKVGVAGKPCSKTLCESGAKVAVFASKIQPAFACPTKELTLYTNLVFGLVQMSIALTGHMPNISPVTGEPEYLDGADGKPNETRMALERMRGEAGVSTFDEAYAKCPSLKNKTGMVVMNYPKDGGVMWVSDVNSKNSYWVAKASLIRQ